MIERRKYQLRNIKTTTWISFSRIARNMGVSQAYLFEQMLDNYISTNVNLEKSLYSNSKRQKNDLE